jgi:hypothetical protein
MNERGAQFWTGVSSTASERGGMRLRGRRWPKQIYCWVGNAEEFVNCCSVMTSEARHGGGGKAYFRMVVQGPQALHSGRVVWSEQ